MLLVTVTRGYNPFHFHRQMGTMIKSWALDLTASPVPKCLRAHDTCSGPAHKTTVVIMGPRFLLTEIAIVRGSDLFSPCSKVVPYWLGAKGHGPVTKIPH